MNYHWKSKKLRTQCFAVRLAPFRSETGKEEFHLKSLMYLTINAFGHGETLESAVADLEENILNLYPTEKLDQSVNRDGFQGEDMA